MEFKMASLIRRLFVAVMLFGVVIQATGQDSKQPECRIALGDFGNTDYAARFRLLVEDELLAQGVNVAQLTDKPEAILSGVVMSTAYGLPEGSLRLRRSNGGILWRYDFPTGFRDHKPRAEAKYLVGLLVKAIEGGCSQP